jgi:hypothetical protein
MAKTAAIDVSAHYRQGQAITSENEFARDSRDESQQQHSVMQHGQYGNSTGRTTNQSALFEFATRGRTRRHKDTKEKRQTFRVFVRYSKSSKPCFLRRCLNLTQSREDAKDRRETLCIAHRQLLVFRQGFMKRE